MPRTAGSSEGEGNLVTQVYLPDGYRDSDERYPVVYWFGGWGTPVANPMEGISRTSLDRAIESENIPPSIVVSMPVDAPTFDHTWVTDLKSTWIGDVNLDGQFNRLDIVNILQDGKFATIQRADWNEGDWDGNQ